MSFSWIRQLTVAVSDKEADQAYRIKRRLLLRQCLAVDSTSVLSDLELTCGTVGAVARTPMSF